MEVKQIATLMNTVTNEVLGNDAVVADDLSNIVDIGKAVIDNDAVDNYVKSLVNHIGMVVFGGDRPYAGSVPSLLMSNWEYGSIAEKITMSELPEAEQSDAWNLTDGKSYDTNVFKKPKVEAKFFNNRSAFDIQLSFTEDQLKESFSNAVQLNAFTSMLYNGIDKSMTLKTNAIIMQTIANMIAETVKGEYTTDGTVGGFGSKSGVRAVNLLYLYNQNKGTKLTADKALTDPEFIRFASFTMGLYETRLASMSTLFNIGGKERFTTKDNLHTVLLSDFAAAAGAYLQSDTFHNEFTALPNAELVPFWQGSGTSYSFADTSSINVKTASGSDVNVSGIVGVMFDHDAMGVTNSNRQVSSTFNPRALFYNTWYHYITSSFNDTNENAVVFFIA